jgi:2-polyprenyl-3-methyl-5-hydroxy-6-metoxy-1,4-benzoquinol methylase
MSLTSAATALKLPPQVPFCPCCESQEVSLSFQKSNVDYHICRPCGFTFVFPWPDDRTLRNHYDDYGRKYYSIDGLKDFLLSPKHCHRQINILLRATKPGRLLDVGCSVGGFVRAASQLGYTAEGIDISLSSVAVGQEVGLKIRAGDFLSAVFPSQFDVITMWATLEHLPDPNRFVRRARELLRPGGILLASVPNFSGITQRLIGTKDRYVGIDHLNYWTARGFASYVARFNFEITETVTFGFNPITLMKDWMNRGQSFSCEQLAVQAKRNLSFKDSGIAHVHGAVEKLLNLGSLGDVVAVAGRLAN